MTLELQSVRNVNKNYGARNTDGTLGGRVDTDSMIKLAVWTVDFSDLQVAPTLSNMEHVIPANSSIISAKFRVVTPWASVSGTSDVTGGLREKDGTLIATTGLFLGSNLTNIQLAIEGNIIDGTGALVGVGIGAADGELVLSPTVSDFTAGRGEVIVEYMIPAALPAA